ncbi:twin-arginine translocase subunit TatC [Cohnella sp. LGH]|uniref:twin-arginine translocase subunit TatC n=1 Tax=Cohnella sp. LGH TaxID=1619153 RepID=UPI001ADCE514|nr:twin-arginine translocase subunit TatC [Cohnella sp. LGH]QTH43855.1 twin-arginine translocase subunit TatC [Cohnella sp. LGH]
MPGIEKKTLTLLAHMNELRRRLIWICACFTLTVIGGMFLAKPMLQFLLAKPPANGMKMNAFSPWDAIGIWMKFALLIGLIVSLPIIMYHVWAFVKPGLHRSEQKATMKYIPFGVIFFVLGLAFAYYIVFPMAFYFASRLSKEMGLQETYGIGQYLSFMFNLLLPISLLFELPIMVMFLTRIKLLNPKTLKKFRRIAYLVLVVIATIITPPDIVSDFLVIIPLIVLFEFSVLLSIMVHRKQHSVIGEINAAPMNAN